MADRLALEKRVDFSGRFSDNRSYLKEVRVILQGSESNVAGIDPKFYWLTLGLLAFCSLVGLYVAYRLQRDVSEDDVPPTEKEVLGPLEQAYYSGLMTKEEFQRINQSMAKQKDGPLPLTKPGKSSAIVTEPADPSTVEEPETDEEEPA